MARDHVIVSFVCCYWPPFTASSSHTAHTHTHVGVTNIDFFIFILQGIDLTKTKHHIDFSQATVRHWFGFVRKHIKRRPTRTWGGGVVGC